MDGGVPWEEDPVGVLSRWEDSGAVWRLEHQADGVAAFGLFTCDGGDRMGTFRCDADVVREYVADRTTNAD